MKIAIDVADLDCERIDGTRVYIQNVLKYLGRLAPEDEFFLFHKTEYNDLLRPAEFKNYHDKSLGRGFWWTQIKFARAVRKLRPGVCWMPIQQIPFLNFNSSFNDLIFKFKLVFSGGKVKFRKANVSSDLKTPHPSFREKRDHPLYPTSPNRLRGTGAGGGTRYVVTIHDLAFKFFGSHFPLVDRLKINFYTDVAVKRADRIIAISEATKRDLIRLYPKIDHAKISVVHHGFDRENFEQKFGEEEKREFLGKWKLIESKVNPTSLKLRGTRSRKSVKLNVKCQMSNDKYQKQEIGNAGNQFKIQNSQPKAGPPGAEKFKPSIRWSRIQNYLLYVGAIQPRKDLVTLIRAFNILKKSRTDAERTQKDAENTQTNYKRQDTRGKRMTNDKSQMTNDSGEDKSQMTNDKVQVDNKSQRAIDVSDLKLVLVGERAWKSESTLREIERSEFKDDIIVTGKVDFKELAMFYRLAKVFVFPSLYEGFGIPILEAMASKVPVIVADNSSLLEVGGDAVLKFKTGNSDDLEEQLRKLLGNKDLQDKMIEQGLEQIKKFSWEKCAKETLEVLRGI